MDPSTDEWVPTKIEGYYKAYTLPLLMPNICHSPWRRPWCRGWGLASSTSKPAVRRTFQCQNGPLENRCDDGWLALSGWPWAQKVGSSSEPPHWFPCSLFGLVALILEHQNRFLAALVAKAAYYQYWLCRGLCWLAPSKTCSKIDIATVSREFRK